MPVKYTDLPEGDNYRKMVEDLGINESSLKTGNITELLLRSTYALYQKIKQLEEKNL